MSQKRKNVKFSVNASFYYVTSTRARQRLIFRVFVAGDFVTDRQTMVLLYRLLLLLLLLLLLFIIIIIIIINNWLYTFYSDILSDAIDSIQYQDISR